MEVNIWKKFISILPGGTRVIGEVIFVNTIKGVSTIKLRDGSQFMANGTDFPVGQKVIVVDGAITAQAPNLPQFDVEV